ncbi:MAG: hypothetical protein AABY07_10810 [Nanoarchaeota archaeon]
MRDPNRNVSDSLYGDLQRQHDLENIMLNPTYEGVAPYNQVVGPEGDNQNVRIQPGRKRGVFSDSGK